MNGLYPTPSGTNALPYASNPGVNPIACKTTFCMAICASIVAASPALLPRFLPSSTALAFAASNLFSASACLVVFGCSFLSPAAADCVLDVPPPLGLSPNGELFLVSSFLFSALATTVAAGADGGDDN